MWIALFDFCLILLLVGFFLYGLREWDRLFVDHEEDDEQDVYGDSSEERTARAPDKKSSGTSFRVMRISEKRRTREKALAKDVDEEVRKEHQRAGRTAFQHRIALWVLIVGLGIIALVESFLTFLDS
ncbi:MAG: hypothetical protein WA705_14110 [Candidatus Ozemobacteraceae bacterium]